MPLFEVPYEMPFIAITERAAARLVNEQYDVLERGSKVHERLERLVIDGGGLDEITASIAGALPGAAMVFDGAGKQVARHPERGAPEGRGGRRDRRRAGRAGRGRRRARLRAGGAPASVRWPCRSRARAARPPAGWLVVVSDNGPLGDFERLIAGQASIVVGLELMRERVVRETERRLAGDLLADALSGPARRRGALRPVAAVRRPLGGGGAGLRAGRPAGGRGGAGGGAGRGRRAGAGGDQRGRRAARSSAR